MFYELKLVVDTNTKNELIRTLGLEFIDEATDTDTFIKSTSGTKEKLKEIDGRIFYYRIRYDDLAGLFVVEESDITKDLIKVKEIKKLPTTVTFQRTKEHYHWPAQDITCSFDYIDDIGNKIYLEISDKNEKKILSAKQDLINIGIKTFSTKTYDELVQDTSVLFRKVNWIIVTLTLGAVVITILVIKSLL